MIGHSCCHLVTPLNGRHNAFILTMMFYRRLAFCRWIIGQSNANLKKILFSDEAGFEMNGCVNSQNVRRYAPLKSTDAQNGGRPGHFVISKPTFSQKESLY